jgi:hypothetical protein
MTNFNAIFFFSHFNVANALLNQDSNTFNVNSMIGPLKTVFEILVFKSFQEVESKDPLFMAFDKTWQKGCF